MKKNLLFGILMFAVTTLVAQPTINNAFFDKVNFRGAFGTSDWTQGWANFDPQNASYGATTVTVNPTTEGITTNTTWTKNNVYLLNGWIYVKSGATLTIEAGTVIRGDKTNKGALIIEKGAKLIANGTVTEPIVFTSNQPAGSRTYGDWGGVIICGKAPINVPIIENPASPVIEGGVGSTYGGSIAADNSGSLQYVRIEFPGIAFATNNEINGLTMGGVGSGTTIDYVQVSYSGDDSFEWFGGTVNAKHLIALRGTDDDFDTDFGYSGMVQYGVSLRDPNVADVAGKSNCFESDNDKNGTNNTPFTTAIFSNISSFGPKATTTTSSSSLYQAAINVKANTKLQVYNSVLAGWVNGIKVESENTKTNMVNNDIKVRNTVISGIAAGSEFTMASSVTSWTATDMDTWFNNASFKNTINADNATLLVADPFNMTAPKFNLAAGSAMNTGSVWYVENNTATIDNNFFDKVNFRGAFGTSDWTQGWANFDPQNASYGATTVTVNPTTEGITTNTTWTKNNVYLLNGWIYVKSGATLTIEAGTVIRGDKTNKGALIIEKGAKLIANGTVTEPIVFTSNQPAGSRTYGDWGGVIICGKAPINVPIIENPASPVIEGGVGSTYGGSIAADNSGSLQYVRIEFPGIAFATNNEINGLTMGGVGSGTTIDYVQVSYSGDDSFEWFGGTVNAKHLIALRGTDDDFDTDFGYSGMVQYGVSLRDPNVADVAGKSNCFESDNDKNGTNNTPFTTAIFSNISSFGPKATTTTSSSSLYQAAINVKANTKLQVYNSVLAGWVNGIKVESENTKTNMVNNDIKVRNTVISGIAAGSEFTMASSVTSWTATDMDTWFNNASFKNTINADNATLLVADPFNMTAPKFNLAAGSALNVDSYWYAPTGIFTPKSTSVNSLRIYPNPASTEVMVELPEFNGVTSIEVRDLTGKLLLSKNTISMEKELVNVSELRKGMYIMVARQGNTTYNQKLTIR